MKLKYNFVINEVAGSKVAVAVGDSAAQFNGFIKMNETGAEIFGLLKSDLTIEELVNELQLIYPEQSKDVLTESVESFVSKLKSAGVLDNV